MEANSGIAIRARARLEWEIQLSLLDEGELAAIEEFFLASQGAFGSFLIYRSVGWTSL